MIGSSVVPGLPNRCDTPLTFEQSEKGFAAEDSVHGVRHDESRGVQWHSPKGCRFLDPAATGQLHVEAVGRPERHLRTSIRNRLARLEQAAALFFCIPNSPVPNRGVAGPRCRSVGSGCAAAAPPGCSRRSRSRSARVYLIPSGRRANTPARMLRPKPEDIARNAVGDPNCRLPHRLAREMRVARRRFLLAVTEKATDHRQRFA